MRSADADMKAVSLQALGFAVPTLLVVTSVHLAREASAAEALDGLGSGLWFAALFLIGGRLGVHLGWRGAACPDGQEIRVALGGIAAGALTWGLLWVLWALPNMETLRGVSGGPFAINSAAMLAAAFAMTVLRRRSAPGQAVPVSR